MEFFGVAEVEVDIARLQENMTIGNVCKMCGSISEVIRDDPSTGEIYCVWGQFSINRENIGHGVRFSLPDCPNALAWTVTSENKQVLVHCTTNKSTHDPDFIESIRQFVQDWTFGVTIFFASTSRA